VCAASGDKRQQLDRKLAIAQYARRLTARSSPAWTQDSTMARVALDRVGVSSVISCLLQAGRTLWYSSRPPAQAKTFADNMSSTCSCLLHHGKWPCEASHGAASAR